MLKRIRWHAEAAAVHPHQICAFKTRYRKFRQLAAAELRHGLVVAVQIVKQLAEPLFPFVVGSDCRRHAKRIHVAHLVDVYRLVDTPAQVVVERHDICNLQPGDVESLARRHTRHRPVQESVRQRRERRVFEPLIHQFAVNLISDHRHAVAQTDVAKPRQLVGSPDASSRIVWIAEQHHFGARVGDTTLKSVEIHPIGVGGAAQRIAHNLAAVVAYRREEAVVDWSLHNHLVARHGQSLYHRRYRRHHSRSVDYPFAVDVPPMPPAEPRCHGIVVGVGHTGVAKDSVRHAFLQRVDDGRRRAEVHVGHPHRQHALGSAVPLV